MEKIVKTRPSISVVIICISVLVWILLLFNPWHIMGLEHCHVSDSGPSAASLKMLLQMNPISLQIIGWVLMVIAMMFPKLIIPVQHIYYRSLKRRRLPYALVFVWGYMAVWLAAGLVMIAAIFAMHLLMPNSVVPAIGLGMIALVLQFSPLKQRCLNRGHVHPAIAAFGWQGYRDSLQFGVTHGFWCVGAGWALMLFPMLLPVGHNVAMLLVTFIMISEHLEHPKAPRWRFDLRARLLRIIIVQTQLKLKSA